MYGLVLTERERKSEARVVLAHAANEYPCHWGAWLALQALCPDTATAAGAYDADARSRSLRESADTVRRLIPVETIRAALEASHD